MIYDFKRTPYDQRRVIDGISVTKAGRIGLTRSFIKDHSVQKGMCAFLYWDFHNKKLAIEFSRSADVTAYPVRHTQPSGAYISASRFFKAHGLSVNEYARRFRYERLDGKDIGLPNAGEKVYVIDLQEHAVDEKHD